MKLFTKNKTPETYQPLQQALLHQGKNLGPLGQGMVRPGASPTPDVYENSSTGSDFSVTPQSRASYPVSAVALTRALNRLPGARPAQQVSGVSIAQRVLRGELTRESALKAFEQE